jgi:hypothetical protein
MTPSISALRLLSPKRTCRFVCVVTLVGIAAYAQSGRSVLNKHPTMFHVEGTIRRGDSGIAGVEVKFEGKDTTKSVFSNPNGFYKAELPFGFYTMAASLGTGRKYRRRFLVTSGTIIILDVVLYDDPDCDPVFPRLAHTDGTPISPEPTQDDYMDVCGGSDLVSVPSEAGQPFELLVHYSNRRRSDAEITYTSHGGRGPIFAAYNLFTLWADKVVYNTAERKITAIGGVVTRDPSGKTKHFTSAIFKIENGEVSVLQ